MENIVDLQAVLDEVDVDLDMYGRLTPETLEKLRQWNRDATQRRPGVIEPDGAGGCRCSYCKLMEDLSA